MQQPFIGETVRVGVIGLGYVGLPLAVAFAEKYPVVGFDVASERVAELAEGRDRTLEVSPQDLAAANQLTFTADEAALSVCNVIVVTVPTPIDRYKRPDLTALLAASRTVGRVIRPGCLVVFESTVYPGATEDDCVPAIEATSGLAFNRDFFVGYSPERANPGDPGHRLSTIIKVTSGSTREVSEYVDALYRTIVPAGTYCASSIRVAEAAKVIENTQRDLNIALINEFSMIFNLLGIDTTEVLEAAGTKWNFLQFRPGLVGGHCIGVDPYYLTSKAENVGYYPQVILSGRRINDGMGSYVAQQLIKALIQRDVQIKGARVLIMGLTFKENCPDLRNTRVIDIIHELKGYGVDVDVYEPWASPDDAEREYGVMLSDPEVGAYSGIVLAVAHDQFRELGASTVRAFGQPNVVVYDLKAIFGREDADLRL